MRRRQQKETNVEQKQVDVLVEEQVAVPGIFTLVNALGTRMRVAEIGAAVMALTIINQAGEEVDLVLGYDQVDDYLRDEYYFGTVVGRYANRIGGGNVKIGQQNYQLNTGGRNFHHHGGEQGFNKRRFIGEPFDAVNGTGIRFRYTSEHGEEGYPGKLDLEVSYVLTDENDWIVEYKAVSDRDTIINLTQHTYFNLSGDPSLMIDDHEFTIPATHYLPVNEYQIPTGDLAVVDGTPFDFRTSRTLDAARWEGDQQLTFSSGYDHSFVLEPDHSPAMKLAASVTHPASGRRLEVTTTEPSVHLYAGNFLDDVPGKQGAVYRPRAGFCLETQHFPDSPNHAHFPSTVLEAGKDFHSRTIFSFK